METNTFISADGKTKIYYYIFRPKNKPRAIVQITHGMMDHILRYNDLIERLNNESVVVCGCDDLGHGETGKNTKYGFFAKKNGPKYVLEDLHTMTNIIKEQYKDIPFFLIGHSMGSFFARLYAYRYPEELNGLMLLGTSGKVAGTNFALLLLNFLIMFKGKEGYANKIEELSTKTYYKYVDKVETGREWVTSNPVKFQEYLNDPKCGFRFTLGAYKDMISTLKFVSSNKWFKKIKKELPIFLASGVCDPVGQYGTGVSEVFTRLEKTDHINLQLKLYEDARHELHNEIPLIANEFFNDVLAWINHQIEQL